MARKDLAALAAAPEQDSSLWQQRFAALLRSSVLRVPDEPGREFALEAGAAGSTSAGQLVWLRHTLSRALHSGAQVALDLSRADTGHWLVALERFSRELAGAPGQLSCSLPLAMLPLAEQLSAQGIPVCVRYGPEAGRRLSQLATASYADPLLRPVPAAAVRPLSALHNAERGQAAMPQALFEVRAGTAWLLLDVDMRRLGTPARARRLLHYTLRFADNLIDAVDWPLPALRLDALLSRRVALRLTHAGDLLQGGGLRPGTTAGFVWLQRQLQFVRRCIIHESMLLARRRGPFPDLCAGDLMAALTPRYGVADARRLLRNRLLRHRHLLALGPSALWPSAASPRRHPDSAWLDMLPVLGSADAITLGGGDLRERLSRPDWARLLQLTAAVAEARGAPGHGVRRAYGTHPAGPP